MSIIPITEDNQISPPALTICPKCGRLVKPNNQCECDLILQLLKKK